MLSWNRHTEAFLYWTAKDFRFSKIVNYFLDFIEIGNNVENTGKNRCLSMVSKQYRNEFHRQIDRGYLAYVMMIGQQNKVMVSQKSMVKRISNRYFIHAIF